MINNLWFFSKFINFVFWNLQNANISISLRLKILIDFIKYLTFCLIIFGSSKNLLLISINPPLIPAFISNIYPHSVFNSHMVVLGFKVTFPSLKIKIVFGRELTFLFSAYKFSHLRSVIIQYLVKYTWYFKIIFDNRVISCNSK